MWLLDDLYVVGQHGVYCVKLSENLSRNSNIIESVGLRKCPYYEYLTSGEVLAWLSLSVWSEVQMICIWSS